MEEVPSRTSLAPLASPCFVLCLIGIGNRRACRQPGEGGDHFHCTVEPPPGHIRCRSTQQKFGRSPSPTPDTFLILGRLGSLQPGTHEPSAEQHNALWRDTPSQGQLLRSVRSHEESGECCMVGCASHDQTSFCRAEAGSPR